MLSRWKSLTSNDSPLGRTFSYYLLFICLGLGLGMAGPTLPSLADQTHTLLSEMGLVFLVGSLGYTLGTMLSGPAFERLPSHRLLGIAQLIVASVEHVAIVQVEELGNTTRGTGGFGSTG